VPKPARDAVDDLSSLQVTNGAKQARRVAYSMTQDLHVLILFSTEK
jgi:hypothetical protein